MNHNNTIAIVGIGGIFPGAQSLDQFMENIMEARDVAREPPPGRWLLDLADVYHPGGPEADKVYSSRACFVDDFSLDSAGLSLDPDFLAALDPAVKLLLYAGRQAWRDGNTASINRDRTGIIIGNIALPTDASSALANDIISPVFVSQILRRQLHPQPQTALLNRYVTGLPAGILARALGLNGGSYTLDAACASSLYAIKYAVDELQAGRADAMLAGGLSRPDSLYTQMGFSALHAISPSGRCAPFDRKADGLVVGEGCGMVMLKRLEDALQQGDHIYATLRGIGLSNDIDGNLMSPASEGQLRAMRAAYLQAGWQPGDVDLIECHGTGTPLGDAVECNSLLSLWQGRHTDRGCVIGSVKSNIGHLLTAAGSAGLIKVLLAMQAEKLPPTANYTAAGEHLNISGSPFSVLDRPRDWDRRAAGIPRRAAISAFGFGGINAHMLVEEWVAETPPAITTTVTSRPEPAEEIAIIGMDACFGPWRSLAAFKDRVLDRAEDIAPVTPDNWWGLSGTVQGYFINQVEIPLGRFRIPPAELQEMLPQQLLMLLTAANAIDDAGMNGGQADALQTAGVYIGIGLDLNTTNFHLRWSLLKRAREWCQALNPDLPAAQLADWVHALREACSPPLTANRTMGALGGIVASRIARAFNVGGPAFTLSSEETSGLRAVEAGMRALQRGEISAAIVGAVDLAGDVRAVLGQAGARPWSARGNAAPFDRDADGGIVGEGAAALVLKTLTRARQDGDRIYAVIKGIGSAAGGAAESIVPPAAACSNAMQRACDDAGIKPHTIGYIESHGSGDSAEDAMEAGALAGLFKDPTPQLPGALGSVKADIGHSGAAGAMAALVKAVLCLQEQVIPALKHNDNPLPSLTTVRDSIYVPAAAHHWLRNRNHGPRRALVNSFSVDGNCISAVLEETAPGTTRRPATARAHAALFCVTADHSTGLLAGLQELAMLLAQSPGADLPSLARHWWHSHKTVNGKRAINFVADGSTSMADLIAAGRQCIEQHTAPAHKQLFYTPEPAGAETKIAFVFPGSGNHFTGMGQQAGLRWPHILERLDRENEYLAGQFANAKFWRGIPGAALDHREVIFGQVWLGTFISDIVADFGIKPDAVIGYSLGETAGLFATRTWKDRDLMLQRIQNSNLFTRELAGPCEAARRTWQQAWDQDIDWQIGVIGAPAAVVRQALVNRNHVYLLIVNTDTECVIGGDRTAVQQLVEHLGCSLHVLEGVTTVHCEVAGAVAQEYRDLHLFDTDAPTDINFYSGILGRAYPVTRDSAADSIVGQALAPFDYTRVIQAAWEDGIRIFIEMGPGATCTRMISQILKHKPHLAGALCINGQSDELNLLRLLARLHAEGIPLQLDALYAEPLPREDPYREYKKVVVPTGKKAFTVPLPEPTATQQEAAPVRVMPGGLHRDNIVPLQPAPVQATGSLARIITNMVAAESARAEAQQAFLRVANGITATLGEALALQMSLQQVPPLPTAGEPAAKPVSEAAEIAYDRGQCLEFATGSIAAMLGPRYAAIDAHPTRVRLPDEPLMLVDRILTVDGKPCAMDSGRVITEHDVLPGAWYLDQGRIPTCIAVEAGQADLFLSAYLGIDLQTRGRAVYRLLDAEITLHGPLPVSGVTIRYDIRIDHFFRQGDTWLFRFLFDGTVNGQKFITMRHGCAGFFSPAELDAGRGIVLTRLEQQPVSGIRPEDWEPPVPLQRESYDDMQVQALRRGDLAGCFGPAFTFPEPFRPAVLPGERMTLVHRILELNPQGGRYGIGSITGEADIHPDDWFLACHFIDDQVMPGTLMYECCLHTLRIFLLRLGWIGASDAVVYEPVTGITSKLKCRGQVTADTRQVQYEVSLKEYGYDAAGTPYAIADALMYGDRKPIVQMSNMSLQLSGLDKACITRLWHNRTTTMPATVSLPVVTRAALFDADSILAFATGQPSQAFGERYRIFDQERVIARLPGPPYQFLDRIVSIHNCTQWLLAAGGEIEAEYDVPADAWYFSENRQHTMPFSILLEIALQPCGWLAAYLGSALTSEVDLSFRNLGGQAEQTREVTPDCGTLTTRIKITRVSQSGGMIIQHFDFEVCCDQGTVYRGATYFGFFSGEALANQVGLRDQALYQPAQAAGLTPAALKYPDQAPFPATMLRMVDEIELYDAMGGPHSLGLIQGTARVNPEAWFFKAHFFQDPVWPGSLGLESFIQLLKYAAWQHWGNGSEGTPATFQSMALNQPHQWVYRGQIIPVDRQVTVQALINRLSAVDRMLRADGFLSVDGRIIYQMSNFTLKMVD